MPILNAIHKVSTGNVGIVEWNGTAEEFSKTLHNNSSAVLVKLNPKQLLVSVSEQDSQIPLIPFHDDRTETSIFLNRRITIKEREEILNVLLVLIDNGSIRSNGLNIRYVKHGTFLNFDHYNYKDCNIVRPFVKYLTNA